MSYISLPLVALTFIPVIYDSTGVPKLLALTIGTLLMIAFNKIRINLNSFFLYIPILLVVWYGITQLFLNNNFESFLLGTFGRNGGFIAIICFTLHFLYNCGYSENKQRYFIYVLMITYYMLLIYGLMQIFKILPILELNNYGSLTLTLQNPNFASAFLGMAISCQLIIMKKANEIRIYQVLILMTAIFQLIQTNSIQGYLIIVLSIMIYLVSSKRIRLNNLKNTFLLIVLIPISLMSILNFNKLINWVYINGSVEQRFNYWVLSLNIFKDKWRLGVGIDNMSQYATFYRNLELTKQEGIFTTPDRSHNVILDHFVNGGIIGGVLWLLFISVVSIFAGKLIFAKNSVTLPRNQLLAIIVWFSYLVQSLISVDQLFLTLLGYISAGIITSITLRNRNLVKLPNKIFRIFNVSFIFTIPFLLLALSFLTIILSFESNAFKFMRQNNVSIIEKLYVSKFSNPKTYEDITIQISKSNDFNKSKKFADKLLLLKPNSHQAKYIQSVYFESLGNELMAKKLMMEALKIDKYNSVYLLSLAIYEFKAGNVLQAREFLEKTKYINPTQKGIDIVEKMLTS